MKKFLQYSIIGSVSIAFFLGGLLSYPLLDQPKDSMSQTLAIGGYGVIKGYHADGTLFYEWEGHNSLTSSGINAISGCISGLDPTPFGFASEYCTNLTSQMVLLGNLGFISAFKQVDTVVTEIPPGCNFNGPPFCEGWQVRGTFDFTDFTCTVGDDCPIMNGVGTKRINPFNELSVTPQEITPGDIIVVTISFNPE